MIHELDLSVARSGEALDLGTEVRRIEVLTAESDLRLHPTDPGDDGIPLEEGRVIIFVEPVQQVWISNDAVAGIAELHTSRLVCIEFGGGGGGGDLEGLHQAAPSSVADGATKQLLIDAEGRLQVVNTGAMTEQEDTVAVAAKLPGTEGNLWDGASTGAGGDSAAVDLTGGGVVSIFGTVDGATDLDLYYSQDGVNFYQSSHQISLAGAGEFGEDFRIGAAFVRLQSSLDVVATATAAVKP